MSGPAVGDLAPDFTLAGIQGEERKDYTLSDLRGHKVVLAFYPGDFTPGCTRQMCSYRDHFDDFEGAEAIVVGISPQTVDRHAEWIQAKGFPFPLLADPDKAVIDAYGVSAPLIGVRRSVFIIDAEGIIRYRHVAIVGVTFRKSSDLAAVLAGASDRCRPGRCVGCAGARACADRSGPWGAVVDEAEEPLGRLRQGRRWFGQAVRAD